MNQPDRCPEGHPLGPGEAHLTWVMDLKRHRLYCTACGGRSRILLDEGAVWEVRTGSGWSPREQS